MGNEEQVKVDTTSQAKAEETALIVKPSGERPTSYVTTKNQLQPLRPTAGLLSDESIHIVHIIIFVLLLFVLYVGMWKKGKKTNF
jgi:hypothetical protein